MQPLSEVAQVEKVQSTRSSWAIVVSGLGAARHRLLALLLFPPLLLRLLLPRNRGVLQVSPAKGVSPEGASGMLHDGLATIE